MCDTFTQNSTIESSATLDQLIDSYVELLLIKKYLQLEIEALNSYARTLLAEEPEATFDVVDAHPEDNHSQE